MTAIAKLRAVSGACHTSLRVFLRDVGAGLLDVGHSSLALVGLCVVGTGLFVASHEDLRTEFERHALDWLRVRAEAREPLSAQVAPPEPNAVARATAADPGSLPRQQAALANWIARRYKVAPEPVSRLVQEAWTVGQRAGLEPTLILAIMAVESSFNPFAQSPMGAQGLMQVMTRVHDDKYEAYGGVRAAFDPVANLRVGVQVLKECIARAGSLEAGLRYYVGAAISGEDGGYVGKVLAEQLHLRQVADGRQVAVNASNNASPVNNAAPAPAPVEPAEPAAVPAVGPSAPAPAGERVAMNR